MPAVFDRHRTFIAVTLSLTVTALIYGLTMPLLALILEREGVDEATIGLNTAVQSLAIFIVAPLMPRLMRRMGAAKPMFVGVVVTIVSLLGLAASRELALWFPLRFLLGVAGAVLWIAGETWVNQIATDANRGRVVAIFNMAIAGGFALGPLIMTATGSEGWPPFLAALAVMAVAGMALMPVLASAPPFAGEPVAPLLGYLRLAPIAMLLCLVFALIEGALLTFLPIYGMGLGLSEAEAVSLITLTGIGGIAVQIPLGWLADRMERRLLTALCVAFGLAGAAAMPFLIADAPWNLVYAFFFGAALSSLYTLGMVLLGERFRDADLASAGTLFGVMWGLGAILGPPLGGLGIELYRPHGIAVMMALVLLLFLPWPVVAYWRRRMPPGA